MISKMSIENRTRRIVTVVIDGVKQRWQLKQEPTFNAGDVQRSFNLAIRQQDYIGAMNVLTRAGVRI